MAWVNLKLPTSGLPTGRQSREGISDIHRVWGVGVGGTSILLDPARALNVVFVNLVIFDIRMDPSAAFCNKNEMHRCIVPPLIYICEAMNHTQYFQCW